MLCEDQSPVISTLQWDDVSSARLWFKRIPAGLERRRRMSHSTDTSESDHSSQRRTHHKHSPARTPTLPSNERLKYVCLCRVW